MGRRRGWRVTPAAIGKHGVLMVYTLIALFPVALVVMNSFKERRAIFKTPLAFPGAETFSTVGYETLGKRGDFPDYMLNSVVVTGGTLILVLLFGSMAAFALARYRFRFNRLLGLYLALGISSGCLKMARRSLKEFMTTSTMGKRAMAV